MIPSFRRDFDAAQDPRTAANALKLQVGVHTQAWDAALDALSSLTTTDNAAARFDGTAGNIQSSALLIADTTAALSRSASSGAAVGIPLQGTNTNDSATAGYVGERIYAELVSASAASVASLTAKNIVSITLTAGDHDVCGVIHYIPANTTTVSVLQASLSNTSATQDTSPNRFVNLGIAYTSTGLTASVPIPPTQISLGSSANIYLVAFALFGTSTCTA